MTVAVKRVIVNRAAGTLGLRGVYDRKECETGWFWSGVKELWIVRAENGRGETHLSRIYL